MIRSDKLTNSQTHKLTNSQTHKLTNSQTHKLTNSQTHKLTNSTRDQSCTLQIAGVCYNKTETTVLAHLPDESAGKALKADDISACFACCDYHAVIDGHTNTFLSKEDKEFYMRRAMVRTWRI